MHSTSFGVSDKLQSELQRACGGAAVGGLQIHIRNETFELGETLPTVSVPALLKAAITPLLDERAPCYLLLSLQSEWALASWVPDAAGVRDKMLYSSGREALRKAFASLGSLSYEAHWAGKGEADVEALFAAPTEEKATLALMTGTERMALEDAKATAVEAASGKVSSASLAFPLTAAAATALTAFESGGRDLLLLHAADTERARPVREIARGSPRVGAVLASLSGRGLEVSKSLEGEPSDLTHELLSSELSAPDYRNKYY
ncbi:hypothetical protein EMIHUDRAFT_456586 [Emiliania huxleyi CCMP1516]|uniref:ADF-H domain-containing protein n=2 Tax=Emiliania huxleyi TaxID=2903 RepID=A0A0D3K3R7_EMIH1|nr:hypothetical protein EMIHUDRAFT_456586 [Emiliania huxleyi CCMP1516]EOD30402.1 hypothetical protein EMIHUDRAFT_456586 [Emiliania huxleyi CCMP1516]|eukprot:XP_005782831.1 hypothetical protein EMIHUDRAFT_456586 [Emiliania huxleyi CCMP1516]